MEITHPQSGLERVVVGTGGGLEIIDVVEIRKGKGAGGNISLVDISETEQLASLRAHIGRLNRHIVPEFLLKVQVVVLDVRRTQVAIHRPGVNCGSEIGEDRHPVLNSGRDIIGCSNRKRTDAVVCWTSVEGVKGEVTDEEVLRIGVVIQTPTAT